MTKNNIKKKKEKISQLILFIKRFYKIHFLRIFIIITVTCIWYVYYLSDFIFIIIIIIDIIYLFNYMIAIYLIGNYKIIKI